MKKFLFSTLALLALMGTAMAQNSLFVNDFEVPQDTKGSSLTVNIQLDEADKYTGFQVYVELPEVFSYVLRGTDETTPLATKGSSLVESHMVSANLDEGMAKVAILSTNSDPVVGTSGDLFSLQIYPNVDLEVGSTYTGTLKNVVFATTEGVSVKVSETTFTITIGDPGIVLDENSTTMPEEVKNVNVKVKRTIKGGSWSTICLPFPMSAAQIETAFGAGTILNDFKGYEADKDNNAIVGIKVNFEAVSEMEANHPYIIKTTGDISEFKVQNVDVIPEEELTVATVNRTRRQWSEFIGTYVAETLLEDKMLFLAGNKFYYSTGSTKMKAFRGYFDFYDVLTEVEEAASKIAFMFDATDIRGINNGFVTENGAVYTLGGQLVGKDVNEDQLPSGVYIRNGKKFVVK